MFLNGCLRACTLVSKPPFHPVDQGHRFVPKSNHGWFFYTAFATMSGSSTQPHVQQAEYARFLHIFISRYLCTSYCSRLFFELSSSAPASMILSYARAALSFTFLREKKVSRVCCRCFPPLVLNLPSTAVAPAYKYHS